MRRFCLVLLILVSMSFLVACDTNTSQKANNATPSNPSATPSEPTTPTMESPNEQNPIVGYWHYEKKSKDCYIAFYGDGTGLIHWYQDYGQQSGLTGYVNKGIRSWSYDSKTGNLHITIAGSDLGHGIITDESYTYKVSKLTESTLVITNNGAYNSSVPIDRDLTRGE